ncbi:FMN-dependent dehydrogenase-domain-containing protein [Pyronema omphalodes]|nr:FMN-dependent dehydrogenase-domain-containing protein [Pyronema omphalodes]
MSGIDFKEVAKHNSPASCWVIIHNNVYDVTKFLPSHPGGSNVILRYAGRDATAEYDPIHPAGILEETLSPSQILGPLDPSTIPISHPSTNSTKPASKQVLLPPLATQISLHDFETTAEKILPPKAWAYYNSAADDCISKHHNNSIFQSILLRPRIFRNVTSISLSTTLLGTPSRLPIFIAPAAMARLAHPLGESAIAQAAGKKGIIQCVSNNASLRPEEISSSRITPNQSLWFQLYIQSDRQKSEKMLQRISAPGSGYTAVVLTLDAPTPGKREQDERVASTVTSTSEASGMGLDKKSHGGEGEGPGKGEGLGKALFLGTAADLTWKDLTWLRKHTHLPIILKGIQTHEDAMLAASEESLKLGVRGIVISNHGGRALDTAPPPLATLMEIRKYAPEVLGKLEVYLDGGIRRGTDVVKALALGARAVGIGRPVLYGLAGYGIDGVERVITILEEEIITAVKLLGVTNLGELGWRCVNAAALERLVWREEETMQRDCGRARL